MTVAGLENGQRRYCPRGVVIVSVLCMVTPTQAPFALCNTFVSIQLGTLISKVEYFTCISLAAIFERLTGLTYERRWVKSA